MSPRLVGRLRKGQAPGTVTGELKCEAFGSVFLLTGTWDGDSYAIEAVPGPIPDGLKLPWEEDENERAKGCI